MLLPRRMKCCKPPFMLPCLLGMVTVIFLCGELTNAQSYSDTPPRYNYERLPKTSFTCDGKLPGRYYPDPETDCQMFHVCVKMSGREVKGFRFLCPNGTVFDAEHQVCIDYYQVVCHKDVGTNPLGSIFEIYKLSSDQGSRDLDIGKLSFVNPDSIERNTLGDDFQVEEYNNNRLASSQNAINFRASQSTPKPAQSSQRTGKSNKAKEDIFFGNKGGFVPSTFDSFQQTEDFNRRKQQSSNRRPVTTSTTTTTTTTEAPSSSSTPRRPSLETFESYETESFSGFIPTRNSFGRGQDPSPDFDSSAEDLTTKDDAIQFRPTQRTTTTSRPYVFQNTFRTTLSNLPSTSRPHIPAQQTFQQQPTRFNEEYFTRLPSTTRRPVSKAAQFFLHSTTADDYFTPEYSQSTVNPYFSRQQSRSSTTTIRPNLVFQSSSGTVRHPVSDPAASRFQHESTTRRPVTTTTRRPVTTTTRRPVTTRAPVTTRRPVTTTTTQVPSTTEYFSRYRQTEDDFETRQTTTYSHDFTKSGRNSNFFTVTKQKEEFGSRPTPRGNLFPPELSTQYVEEETLRPRSIHGASNPQNGVSIDVSPSPVTIVDTVETSSRPWDNFGFSTVPPPTTAEPFSTPPPTTAASAVTQQETAQTLAARLQGQLFKKTTTKNPEKFAIFFGRGTTPSGGNTTGASRKRVRSTTASPFDFESSPSTTASSFGARGRFLRVNIQPSTSAPDVPDSSSPTPLRRGVRRRVRPGRRLEGKEFDPQLKYQRRRFESGRLEGDGIQKNDEIFNAEASVFRGDPSLNNFFEDNRRKPENSDSGSNADQNEPQKVQRQKQRQPANDFPPQFYGRRVRPGANAQQSINNGGRFNNGSAPTNNFNNGEGHPGPQIRRRVVKRIRPKTSTTQPESGDEVGVTPNKQFVVTGSTLRPVTRINVKTKLGGKVSTTYRTTEITDGSSSPSPSSTTTTTEEPELVTASDNEVQERKHHQQAPLTHQQAYPDLKRHKLSNNSHLVIKVLEKPFSPSPPIPNSPFSIKKPILNSPKKFALKPAAPQHPAPVTGPNKSQSIKDEENQTRSPDYDYAYYNTDDSSDYDAETSSLDHKNYGKKPRGN